MSIEVERITSEQAQSIIHTEEGQFSDVKAIEITPANLTKFISAFADSDGGDLFVGIGEDKNTQPPTRSWRGFENPESANGHLQIFEKLFPLGTEFQYEFMKCDAHPGLVLHVQINKTKEIKCASNGLAYVRRGAQSLPCSDDESKKRLEYSKGITSFETHLANVSKAVITESDTVKDFIKVVVPSAQPEAWLKKQILIQDDRPTVGGLLLFAGLAMRLL